MSEEDAKTYRNHDSKIFSWVKSILETHQKTDWEKDYKRKKKLARIKFWMKSKRKRKQYYKNQN